MEKNKRDVSDGPQLHVERYVSFIPNKRHILGTKAWNVAAIHFILRVFEGRQPFLSDAQSRTTLSNIDS